MRWFLSMSLVLPLVSGCQFDESNETVTKSTDPRANRPEGGTPGNPIIPRPSGGSGGAAQAVRGAATRIVAMGDMQNIRIFMENATDPATGRLPDAQTIRQALAQGDPKVAQLVEEGDIILTGIQQREGIWAYTKNAHNGQHIVLSQAGVERVTAPELEQRLQLQR